MLHHVNISGTTNMEQWLDSLSEDWVSQPRSQPGSSSLPGSPQPSESLSNSKIPKPKPGSVSTGRGGGSHKDVLKPRTPSQINSSGLKRPNSGARSLIAQASPSSRKSQAKNVPAPSLRGTVQQKATLAKGLRDQATPEWKRRLVNGNKDAGEETDLLSPKGSGLEKVFKPPTVRAKEAPKGIGRRRAPLDERKEKTGTDDGSKTPDIADARINQPVRVLDALPSAKGTLRKPTDQLSLERNISTPAEAQSLLVSDESQSDNFSPALLSKHTAPNGQIHYTATPSPKKRPSVQGNALEQQRSISLSKGISEAQAQAQTPSLQSEGSVAHHPLVDITSQSLPDDLSVGTDAFIANGGFVETKRGGYAEDDSFQQKSLSFTSSSRLDGPSLKESSDSYRRSPERTSPRGQHSGSPRTPSRPKQHLRDSPERPKSSGSPLKLFDNYDSFTNDRLLRRMSKFEETLAQESYDKSVAQQRSTSPSPGPKKSRRGLEVTLNQHSQDGSRVSSFGEGELDKFPFFDPLDQEPSLPRYPPTSVNKEHPEISNSSGSKPKLGSRSRREERSQPSTNRSRDLVPLSNEVEQEDWNVPTNQGKRQRRSPLKGSSPKRRRTIENSPHVEVQYAANLEHSDLQLTPARALLSRKRKDARYENEDTIADPEILALRQMRRPRNPTPNQASSSDRRSPPKMSPYSPRFIGGKDRKTSGVTQDRSTHILADVLATNALQTAQKMAAGSRKPSVTTDNYLNEAQAIMSLIRSEKRPHSSHETFNQSKVGQETIYEESMFFNSTKDDFSRPPSREGSVPSRSRAMPPLDARAVSQLRKFEDHDDLGLALGNSMKTLRLTHSRSGSTSAEARGGDQSDVESDPPNVRIRERLGEAQHLAQKESPKSNHRRQGSEDSNPSSGRSFPTRSSGSSSNKMVIAPESVAHLLTDRIAGMTFDRERQKWVKAKTDHTEGAEDYERGPEESDDDMFDSIPDLSVDEMEELQRVRDAVVESHSIKQGQKIGVHDYQPVPEMEKPTATTATLEDARPRTAEGKSIPPADDSSAPSKFSHFAASSGAYPSTRATSWGGDDMWSYKVQPSQATNLAPVAEGTDHHSFEEVEHEISIMEGRVATAPNHGSGRSRKARVVTVTFSSPVVNQMHSPARAEHSANDDDASFLSTDWQEPVRLRSPHTRSRSTSVRRKSSRRSMSRRMSLDDQPRPMSRVDEYDEVSLVRYSTKGNKTLDLAISTPLPLCRSLLAPSSSSHGSAMGFSLSPLQDFTVHQVDRSLDGETGAIVRTSDRQDLATPSKKLSLTAQEVIKHLTDLEPYEPYWEYIRSVDLQGRALKSLHMLDDFCGQLVHLNVAGNNLNELNGIPSSVRLLDIQRNCLCDLSSWHHLQNLQFLDVSANGLTSLKGFWSLVHLRGLKIDGNGIDSLTGLEGLDGLMSLSARGNRLRRVDFEEYDL